MKEALPTHFPLDGHQVSFGEISRKFALTQHGEKLKNNIRYGPFKPAEVSNKAWEKILGADVNNFNHLNLTLGLTKRFLAGCEKPHANWEKSVSEEASFNAKEKETLLLTAVVHDWAEAVIGDIPFPDKKKSDEEMEMIHLRKLVHEVVGEGKFKRECDAVADRVEGILMGTDTKLGKAFNAIEKVGYMRTGLRAWGASVKHGGTVKKSLEHLGFQVVTDHLPSVLKHGETYPPVDLFVNHHTSTISHLIIEGSARFSGNQRVQFVEAKNVWENRLQAT